MRINRFTDIFYVKDNKHKDYIAIQYYAQYWLKHGLKQ